MKVVTDIRKLDLIHFNVAILPTLKSTYVSFLFLALLSFGFICWKSGVPQTIPNWGIILFGSLMGGIVGMLFGTVCSMISILLMSSNKNGILGEHEYTLSADGLYEKTTANEGLSKWSGIISVKVVGPYLLFQISGYLFHIVPRRSFQSKACFNEYVENAVKYWEIAHNKQFKRN